MRARQNLWGVGEPAAVRRQRAAFGRASMREPLARAPLRRLRSVVRAVTAAMRLESEPDRALEPPHRAHDNLSAHAPADPAIRLVRAAWSELDQHQVSDDEPLLEFDVAHVSTSAHGLTLRTR